MRGLMNMRQRRATMSAFVLLGISLGATSPASAQLVDAGGQANLMQQHTLMRNQSTGDGPDWVDREALRQKNGGKVLPGSSARRDAPVDQAALERDMRHMIERRRAQLLPEYERRVRRDGRASADRWLREVAAEMGRRDGEQIKARYGQ